MGFFCPGAAQQVPAAEGLPADENKPHPLTRWPPGPADAPSTAGGEQGWASGTEPTYSPLREREIVLTSVRKHTNTKNTNSILVVHTHTHTHTHTDHAGEVKSG